MISFIDSDFIESHTDYKSLMDRIKKGFASSAIEVPQRHHHNYKNPLAKEDSTLLIMPAWNPGKDLGVKLVTVSPENGKYNLPAIQGTYILFDAYKGMPKAILEAKALTAKRTAATSALAASFLAREDASSLLMIGTGALSSQLILAHSAVRPIKKVYVWGRDVLKAEAVCEQLINENMDIETVTDIDAVIGKADIISVATLSKTPLIKGKFLQKGQHIDLVGAFKKDMREADDAAIKRSSVFVDTVGGMKESGDIFMPLQNGALSENKIKADLPELCRNVKKGRINDSEITLFKSVGHALEDLVAAKYYFDQFTRNKS
jgi:ornithine cyclodeaminase